uniref:Protein arginine methyltransferase NDUFAF7 n=1 Tax=Panagrellus redivivus TaxID=6233 RepID=A0A7E4VJU3_PANRE
MTLSALLRRSILPRRRILPPPAVFFQQFQRRSLSSADTDSIQKNQSPLKTNEALYYFIRDKIRASGPITVHEYMQLAVGSGAGYYANRGARDEGKIFGSEGDFVTSPELCQVFGELLAVWAYYELGNTGHKGQWQLVEMGPGTGQLMADMLGVINRFKEEDNLTVHLVESSDALIDEQEKRLCGSLTKPIEGKSYVRQSRSLFGVPIYWHKDLSDVPDNFSIYVANEFLDALPIHQFTKTGKGWHEVYVNLDENNKFCFMLSKNENLHTKGLIPEHIREENRRHWEVSPEAATIVTQVGEKIVENGGFALFVDYGHDGNRKDLSLRAYRKHTVVDPLESPGHDDITADVNFGYFKELLQDRVLVYGPTEQWLFLSQMGILARMQYLMTQCKEREGRESLLNAYKLLMTPTKDGGMGEAFKAFALFPQSMKGIMEKRGGFPEGFRPLGWKPPVVEKAETVKE